MHKVLTGAALALALAPSAVVAAELAAAPQAEIHFLGADGQLQRGTRCAAPTPTAAEVAALQAAVEDHIKMFGRASDASLAPVSIPIRWHVIRSGTSTVTPPSASIMATNPARSTLA